MANMLVELRNKVESLTTAYEAASACTKSLQQEHDRVSSVIREKDKHLGELDLQITQLRVKFKSVQEECLSLTEQLETCSKSLGKAKETELKALSSLTEAKNQLSDFMKKENFRTSLMSVIDDYLAQRTDGELQVILDSLESFVPVSQRQPVVVEKSVEQESFGFSPEIIDILSKADIPYANGSVEVDLLQYEFLGSLFKQFAKKNDKVSFAIQFGEDVYQMPDSWYNLINVKTGKPVRSFLERLRNMLAFALVKWLERQSVDMSAVNILDYLIGCTYVENGGQLLIDPQTDCAFPYYRLETKDGIVIKESAHKNEPELTYVVYTDADGSRIITGKLGYAAISVLVGKAFQCYVSPTSFRHRSEKCRGIIFKQIFSGVTVQITGGAV